MKKQKQLTSMRVCHQNTQLLLKRCSQVSKYCAHTHTHTRTHTYIFYKQTCCIGTKRVEVFVCVGSALCEAELTLSLKYKKHVLFLLFLYQICSVPYTRLTGDLQ
jgi:hypothetical protein